MRSRFLTAAALIALAAPLQAADPPAAPPPQPAPDTETQISFEVRVMTLPDIYFAERVGIDFQTNTGAPAKVQCRALPESGVLTDAQLRELLEAVQADRRSNVMQCPKVTLDDGQETTVRATQRQFFVTGLEAVRNKGAVVMVPKNTPVDTGFILTEFAKASADRKTVTVKVNYKNTRIEGPVEMVPVTTQITPVFEGGSRGKPIPFTQYIEVPQVETFTIEKADLTLPSGGHAIIPGPAATVEARSEFGPPFLSKIPYVNRMFKNVGIARTTVRTYLVVTPRVLEVPAEPAAQR